MTDLALERALAASIAAVRSTCQGTDAATLAEVAAVVMSAKQTALLREVESLARTIAETRADIAALSVTEITGRHIPAATDELDAIVSHTALATDTIIASCETLDALAATLAGPASASVQAATTRIYEACTFQDITGQRIMRVVAALKAIDAKVATIVGTQHHDGALTTRAQPMASGPQLSPDAMRQADVDHILADLG